MARILRQFGEHTGAQRDRVLLVHRDARHARDRVAAQCREPINDRAEAARMRLQDGSEPVEQIARAVGFNDPERMRRAFVKLYGIPPQAIRRADRQSEGAASSM